MRIQHNITALNAYRQLGNNNNAVAKNLEKLSSGYKINRAGDDAAGLAISEKMRAQIKGLEAAQKNSNDGISLIQTAEGNLQEVHSMLNRMVELATMAANGTYEDTNRAQYQKEIDALNEEIDRIAQSANFNGKKLLDGSLSASGTTSFNLPPVGDALNSNTVVHKEGGTAPTSGTKFSLDLHDMTITASANAGATVKFNVGGHEISISIDANKTATAGEIATKIAAAANGTFAIKGSNGVDQKFKATVKDGTTIEFEQMNKPTSAGEVVLGDMKISVSASNGSIGGDWNPSTTKITNATMGDQKRLASTYFELKESMIKEGASITIGKDTYTFKVDKDSSLTGTGVVDVSDLDPKSDSYLSDVVTKLTDVAKGNSTYTVGHDNTGGRITITEKEGQTDFIDANNKSSLTTKKAIADTLSFVAGKGGSAGGLTLQVGDTNDSYQKMTVSIDSTSVASLGLDGVDVSTETSAGEAIAKINSAIDKVSDIRAGLGALQNRLDHTINNLGVATENITAAESRIRDTDMAKEMMDFTKNNILVQAAQAMLAQANMVPQGVLQLLQ